MKEQYTAIDKLLAMMKQCSDNSATYKEYQERSAFTQKSFRKKNAAAIDAFEEADKYIAEHIKPYYIKGKPPKLSDLQAMSAKMKKKYNALLPSIMLSSEERRRHRSTLVRYESILTISVSRSVTGSTKRKNAHSRKRKTISNNRKDTDL